MVKYEIHRSMKKKENTLFQELQNNNTFLFQIKSDNRLRSVADVLQKIISTISPPHSK